MKNVDSDPVIEEFLMQFCSSFTRLNKDEERKRWRGSKELTKCREFPGFRTDVDEGLFD